MNEAPNKGIDKEGLPIDRLQHSETDAPKASYVPVGYDDREAFLQEMREMYDDAVGADQDNRDEALDDKQFVAGEQWDPEVLDHREGLPCLTINTIPQFTAQVTGDWREERPAIKVLPAEDGDIDGASIRGDLIRAIELESRSSRVYNNGFESMIQCGDGGWQVNVEYARDDVFDQVIRINPIDDALAMVWDPLSCDPTGRDAKYCFVDDRVPNREFKRKYPGKDPSTLGAQEQRTMTNLGWIDDDSVRVTNFWRMISKDRLLAMFEDGTIHIIDGNAGELTEVHGQVTKSRVSGISYAQLHVMTGHDILAGPYEYRLNRLPVIRCTGRVVNVGGERVRFGLTRFMKDSVRLRNFWRSISAEQLGYSPKAQWMATEEAVEGREEEIRNAHLSRDPLLVFNNEAVFGSNVHRVEPPAPQSAILNEANINAQDLKDVTGIHDASLGIRSNETSGKAINARQREGDVASLTYYDNGNASVLETGDVINQLIGQIYDGTRIVRIVGEDEAAKFVKINDPYDPNSPDMSFGKYDVALATGPSYSTRRVEAAEAMMGAIQVWPQLMEIAGDLVVKAQNWPGAEKLADRIKKTIPKQFLDSDDPENPEGEEQGPTQEEMMQMQQVLQEVMQEMQTMQQENEALKADKTIERGKLSIEEFRAETERAKVTAEYGLDEMALVHKAVSDAMDKEMKWDESMDKRKLEQSKFDAAPAPGAPSTSSTPADTGTDGAN